LWTRAVAIEEEVYAGQKLEWKPPMTKQMEKKKKKKKKKKQKKKTKRKKKKKKGVRSKRVKSMQKEMMKVIQGDWGERECDRVGG